MPLIFLLHATGRPQRRRRPIQPLFAVRHGVARLVSPARQPLLKAVDPAARLTGANGRQEGDDVRILAATGRRTFAASGARPLRQVISTASHRPPLPPLADATRPRADLLSIAATRGSATGISPRRPVIPRQVRHTRRPCLASAPSLI